jgi:hypothetical protein
MTTTNHAPNLSEAIRTARPIKGTRYALGSFLPTVGLSARQRAVYVLTLEGVEVDRGSKADLTQAAKAPEGSPLGECHARYDAVLEASGNTVPAAPMTEDEKADAAWDYLNQTAIRHARQAAVELDELAAWATTLAKSIRTSPKSGYTARGGSEYLTRATERLAKADAMVTLMERADRS